MWPKPNINDFRSKDLAKMLDFSKPITDRFLKKGFTPEEIPELLNDLIHLIEQSDGYTTNYVNQELENLCWGIQILDESFLNEIASSLISNGEVSKLNYIEGRKA